VSKSVWPDRAVSRTAANFFFEVNRRGITNLAPRGCSLASASSTMQTLSTTPSATAAPNSGCVITSSKPAVPSAGRQPKIAAVGRRNVTGRKGEVVVVPVEELTRDIE